ncbi:metallophosphoesterase [Tyzzerella sp. OttesenSCG-928-J15]|nr:metallophosphoesterase [Tyzzerella sp. OttesenSCG-928-J15]
MKKVENISAASFERMIFTSDIHGNYEDFKNLLNKLDYNSQKDALFIAGDLVYKGAESLKVLRYVMDLCKKGNVHVVIGNCDFSWRAVRYEEFNHRLMEIISDSTPDMLHDMCSEIGYTANKQEDTKKLIGLLEENFGEVFDYLEALPHIITAEDFVLTHDGLRSNNPSEWADESSEKINSFMDNAPCFDKYIIVGHWPVDNYRKDRQDLTPVIDHSRKIISLDGGNVIKSTGQINAIVVNKHDFQNTRLYYSDKFQTLKVKCDSQGSEESHYISWPDNKVDIIRHGEEFTLCRQKNTGVEMEFPSNLLREIDGEVICYSMTDYRIAAKAGDEIGLIKKYSDRSCVKKDGVVGWLDNNCIDFSQK